MYDRKKPFKVEKIAPRIYLANFENQYDLAMTFCRYQEFYESPSEEFRGRRFTLLDFMEYYSKEFGEGSFTYAVDWVGFNVPGKCISECYLNHNANRRYADNNCDLNRYDEWMWYDIYMKCLGDDGDPYIIGSVGNKGSTFDHELAHALYYTDQAYKFEMNQLIGQMAEKDVEAFNKYFERVGYTKEVFKDETQAYMATGLVEELLENEDLKPYIVNFEAVFNKRNPLNK